MGRLDELLTGITPVMAGVGFKYSAHCYRLEAEDGAVLVVQFRSHDTFDKCGFLIDWGIVPRSVIDYNRIRSPRARIKPYWGILYSEVFPDAETRWGRAGINTWSCAYPSDVEICSADIAEMLRTQLLPTVVPLLHNRVLLEAAIAENKFGPISNAAQYWHPYDRWVQLTLHVDDGDGERIGELIGAMKEQDATDGRLEWFSRRFADRLTAETGRQPSSE